MILFNLKVIVPLKRSAFTWSGRIAVSAQQVVPSYRKVWKQIVHSGRLGARLCCLPNKPANRHPNGRVQECSIEAERPPFDGASLRRRRVDCCSVPIAVPFDEDDAQVAGTLNAEDGFDVLVDRSSRPQQSGRPFGVDLSVAQGLPALEMVLRQGGVVDAQHAVALVAPPGSG